MHLRHTLIALAALACASPSVAAPAEGPCRSPRDAARTFLDHLEGERPEPHRAARCFERPTGLSGDALARRVQDLKAVLDARGLEIVLEDLSAEPDHTDEAGRARATPIPEIPRLVLVKRGDEWRFPARVVEQIPELYRATFSSWTETALNRLPGFLREPVLGYQAWQLLGLILLLGVAFVVSRLVRALVPGRVMGLLRRWGIDDGAAVVARVARPLGLLVGTGVFVALLPELRLSLGAARTLVIAAKLVAALAAVAIAYRLVDLLALPLERRAAATESRMDDQLVMVARKAMRVGVVAVGVVFVLQNLHVDVGGLLAGLGLGGLAFALAAKDAAANLFGSVTIFVDRPFQVGDWIVAAGVEGTVEEIGLRSTRVRTFYNSVVSVPNSVLATTNVDNMSQRQYRRMTATLSLAYHTTADQLEAFVEGVRAILAAHPDTRKDYYEVHFKAFGESSLDVMFYAFVKADSWSRELQARHQIFLEVKRLAEALGVEFAFPTRTLHIETQAKPTDRVRPTAPAETELAATVAAFGPSGERSRPTGRLLTHGYFAGQLSARGTPEEGQN